MSFVVDAAQGALDLSLDRIRRGADHGEFNPRPEIDPKQQAEFLDEQRGGRTDEAYQQCLRYHGFKWFDVQQLPMLEGGVNRREGEWRHRKLTLAFTPTDLASGFPAGPESLDKYIRDEILKAKVAAGRAEKRDLKKFRDRK